MHFLEQASVFLLVAVLVVPLFQRLRLGAVLGYLVAGMLVGPSGAGLVGQVESTLQFAEFGVVLLLFLVGLELDPARLWALRRPVFGMGGAQVAVTGVVLGLLGIGGALIMGRIGLSMSLGAFLAGVLLADSEFRHELEADIEPFKGLLLGLFFIAVGMSANLGLLTQKPMLILGFAVALLVIKFILLYVIARVGGDNNETAQRLAIG